MDRIPVLGLVRIPLLPVPIGPFLLTSLLIPHPTTPAGGMDRIPVLGLIHIPLLLVPFGSLLLTSLLIPRASFVGHLSGIVMGYVIALGGLDWLDSWWAPTAVVWVFAG
jgi:hypothetical protein